MWRCIGARAPMQQWASTRAESGPAPRTDFVAARKILFLAPKSTTVSGLIEKISILIHIFYTLLQWTLFISMSTFTDSISTKVHSNYTTNLCHFYHKLEDCFVCKVTVAPHMVFLSKGLWQADNILLGCVWQGGTIISQEICWKIIWKFKYLEI